MNEWVLEDEFKLAAVDWFELWKKRSATSISNIF